MDRWKLSCYTSVIDGNSDCLLYNSFMGAIAHIPSQSISLSKFCCYGATESDLENPVLKELCEQGFFVRHNVAERKLVSRILDKERNATFSVIILAHENCNFRCTYCYEKFERGKMGSQIVEGMKALVERKSREYKSVNVSWFGGEPLLAKDVVCELSDSFSASCARNNATYTSSMTTNGYLLVPVVVDALMSRGVKYFQVTLDGPQASHDKMRKLANGNGTYKQILENLALMRQRSDDFTVRIRVNFDKNSLPLMGQWLSGEIAPLFASDRRFAIRFHAMGKWGGPNDSKLDTCDEGLNSSIKPELFEKSQALGFSDEVAKEFLKPHGNVCYAAKESSIVVGSDGTLYKCTVAFDDVRNHLGKLTRDGKLLIDRSLWNMWVTVDEEALGYCISCKLYPVCQGRKCPLGAMNQKKPVCPLTVVEYESLVKLIALKSSEKIGQEV